MTRGVVLFSPSLYSHYSLCSAELLRRSGAPILGFVVVRLLNLKRLVREFRRDGAAKIAGKVWEKLLVRGRRPRPSSFPTLRDKARELGVEKSSLPALASAWKVPLVSCRDHNEPQVLAFLEQTKPELVAFTGGGLIKSAVLQRAGLGVVNCHSGILPRYRGMDVVEWALLEGRPGQVGLTTHLMDEGIDTGPILRTRLFPPGAGEDTPSLRLRMEAEMPSFLVETCSEMLGGTLRGTLQTPGEGRQYFTMHPQLLELLNRRLTKQSPAATT